MRLLAAMLAFALSSAAAPPAPQIEAYLSGLDALRDGRYSDAEAHLTQAIAQQTAPEFLLARGVARTLAQTNIGLAFDDLSRAKTAMPSTREPELWIYAAESISGRNSPAHRTPFHGMPGHMAQGGADYSGDYATLVYYEMASPFWMRRQDPTKPPPDPAKLREAGAWFANRAAARADFATIHIDRARQHHAAGRFPSVLENLQYARPADPLDPDLLFYSGDSWGALGRPATSRRELTASLTGNTLHAPAYISRAFAAARLGDAARASADLAVAIKINPAMAARYRANIENELAANRNTSDPQQLYTSLDAAAHSAQPLSALIEQAVALHKAAANGRRHYSEWYQDRIRELESAIRVTPKDPGPRASLAAFLIAEADLRARGEGVEPRRGILPYRRQRSQASELRRALNESEAGLKLNPNHIACLMQKATSLDRLGDPSAESIANRVLQIAPRHPDALRMRAQFLVSRAGNLFAQASALRSPRIDTSSHFETRSDGVYQVTTTYRYDPSPAELTQAAAADARGRALMQQASAAIQSALAVTRGTLAGFLLQAEVDLSAGRTAAARAALDQALKFQPGSLEANWALTEFFRRTGATAQADRQRSVTMNLVHTTAAWILKQAWPLIVDRNTSGAHKLLAEARQLDPTDARIPAYLGALARANGDTAEATAQFLLAIAIDEAKLKLDAGNAAAAHLPRDPEPAALSLALRRILADDLRKSNPPAAVDMLAPAALWIDLVSKGGRATPMFGAMLPLERSNPHPAAPAVAAPSNAATILVRILTSYAAALRDAKRPADALAQLERALSLGRNITVGIPNIGNGRGDTNYAHLPNDAAMRPAVFALIDAHLSAGQCAAATSLFTSSSDRGFGNVPDPDYIAEPQIAGRTVGADYLPRINNCREGGRNTRPAEGENKRRFRIPFPGRRQK